MSNLLKFAQASTSRYLLQLANAITGKSSTPSMERSVLISRPFGTQVSTSETLAMPYIQRNFLSPVSMRESEDLSRKLRIVVLAKGYYH